MNTIENWEEKLRETSPNGYIAVKIFADDYIQKAKEYERSGRELLDGAEKVVHGNAGQVYSDGVHKGADWGGKVAGAATAGVVVAAGAALGGLLAGPLGAVLGGWLVSGVAGVLGGAVQGFVTNLVESAGRALAGALGLDFHTHGKTPGGGTWNRTDHPNGDWERTEIGPDFNVTESQKGGVFSQTIVGKGASAGYSSHFTDNGKGVAHFEAVDRAGIFHNFNQDDSGSAWGTANSHDTDKSNGKNGSHVSVTGSNGAKSDLWFYNDGSSKETHTSPPHTNDNGSVTTTTVTTEKDKDGHTTGQTKTSTTTDKEENTTTKTTTTDREGGTHTQTHSHDKNGNTNNPPQPPPGDDSSRSNPEGNGSEGPPVRPGEIGKGRPGHPMDHLVPPGSWQKDNGEWQGEQPPVYRDMLAGILLVLNPYAKTGHGDAADPDAQREDLLRLLRSLEMTSSASGEDFVHPKAKAGLLGAMMGKRVG